MKRFLLFLNLLLCLWLQIMAQNQVYYYELEKTVKNGTQSSASGDGHYLAINSQGLYECEAGGSSLGYGFVHYMHSNNGYPTFQGKAYLGSDLSYVFSSDYSRLNLYLDDGTIRVYSRRSSASSASSKRVYKAPETPVYVDPGPAPAVSSSSTAPTRRSRQCSVCKGTGREPRWSYIGGSPGVAGKKKWCDVCHKEESYGHYHVYCSTCKGDGWIDPND